MCFKSGLAMKETEMLNENLKFKQWKKRVENNGIVINNVKVLGMIRRGSSNRIFIDSELVTPEGRKMSRCVLISGESVIIVPVLKCHEDNEIYTLMVEQRRIVDGAYSVEFPAGDLDLDQDPITTACQEVREELNLNILPEELFPLMEQPIKINPSYSDVLAYFYYFERNVNLKFLEEIDGSDSGCRSENEYIKIRVRKMSHVSSIPTSSAIIGAKLLEKVLSRVF